MATTVNQSFKQFHSWYKDKHIYSAVSVCCIGILLNLVNAVVLTRKTMKSPVNNILCVLSISDLLYLSVYVAYMCLLANGDLNSKTFVVVYITTKCSKLVFHSMSLWLNIILAQMRYVIIARPLLGHRLFSSRRIKFMIAAVAFSVLACTVPIFGLYKMEKIVKMRHAIVPYSSVKRIFDRENITSKSAQKSRIEKIVERKMTLQTKLTAKCSMTEISNTIMSSTAASPIKPETGITGSFLHRTTNENRSIISINNSSLLTSQDDIRFVNIACVAEGLYFAWETHVREFYNWWKATTLAVLPCTLLIVFTILMAFKLFKGKRKAKYMGRSNSSVADAAPSRITKMLLIVVVLTLITEIPLATISLLQNFHSRYMEIYIYLHDILEFLVLVNSSVNFAIYCKMSTKFRASFCETFCQKCKSDDKQHQQQGKKRTEYRDNKQSKGASSTTSTNDATS